MRLDARAVCDVCGEPVGLGVLFYSGWLNVAGEREGYRHFKCDKIKRSTQRAARLARTNAADKDRNEFANRKGKYDGKPKRC